MIGEQHPARKHTVAAHDLCLTDELPPIVLPSQLLKGTSWREKPLSILEVAPHFEGEGGTETYVKNLNTALMQDHDVTIHVLYETQKKEAKERSETLGRGKIVYHPLYQPETSGLGRLKKMAGFGKEINRLLRTEDIDVVNLHSCMDPEVTAACGISLLRRVPLVITRHVQTVHPTSKNPAVALGRSLGELVFRHADRRVGVGLKSTESMGDDCTVIGSLFDLKFFDPDVQGVDPTSFRDELGVTDEKILLYPARITPGKGQMDFLKACVKLREAKGDTFRAVIVGPVCDEEYLNSQKEFISVNNLDKIARILPSVDRSRVRNMYAASYAVVCPSYTEALPLIPLESMSMKKPVLAYKDVPGIDEVVLPEKTGLLVKKGDPNAIAEGVIRLFDDPALASELGEFGRRLVAADYSPEMLARRYMSLYSELRKSRAATKRKIGWISPRVES